MKNTFKFCCYAMLLLLSQISFAQLDIADEPLFLQSEVEPNVLFVIDDSGSMFLETVELESDLLNFLDYTPDSDIERNALCRADNALAFDPDFTYTPWRGVDINSVPYANESYTSARYNPYESDSTDVDVRSSRVLGSLVVTEINTEDNAHDLSGHFYFEPDSSGNCPTTTVTTHSDCLATSGCIAVSNLDSASQTNYANWYSYYRSRHLLIKRALSEVIYTSEAKLGLATFRNNGDPAFQIQPMTLANNRNDLLGKVGLIEPGGITPLRRHLEEAGQYFQSGDLDIFHALGTSDPTPANVAACQQNFTVLMTDGFANDPGYSPGISVENADSDGVPLYNGVPLDSGDFADPDSPSGGPTPAPIPDDDDEDPTPIPTPVVTLADIAMHYFETDLKPAVDNLVPEGQDINNSGENGDMHQHMVTFGVAFGVDGEMTCNPVTDESCTETWPHPDEIAYTSGDTVIRRERSIDDLVHATANGRGQFLSAKRPDDLITGLQEALADIQSRQSSSSSVASNSTTLNEDTVIFQARFETGEWSGDMIATPISTGPADSRAGCTGLPEGAICESLVWTASGTDPDLDLSDGDDNYLINDVDPTNRVIITSLSNATGTDYVGLPFNWTVVENDPDDVADLFDGTDDNADFGEAMVNYIRGDQTHELDENGEVRDLIEGGVAQLDDNGDPIPTFGFRRRSISILGDVVNSAPNFVALPRQGFDEPSYATFVQSQASRTPVVYVGANDGMLHGFNADTGEILLSYVPRAMHSKMSALAEADYQHQFYVDGSPTVGDVFFDSAWHSVLLGSYRAGAKSIFALDVTDPSSFSEANANDIYMWEFFDDTYLGYTFAQPDIVKLSNGTWVAIFGNGYGSNDGRAYLYVVNIETGAEIARLETDNTQFNNGLSTATPVDLDFDGDVDYIYAGDLQGGMWRFDVTSTNPSSWPDGIKLFQTQAPEGGIQSITSRPSVGFHPDPDVDRAGVVVYFGTGRYFTNNDVVGLTSQPTNTFYAIWDENPSSTAVDPFSGTIAPARGGSEYLVQTITDEFEFPIGTDEDGNFVNVVLRQTSNLSINWNTHRGWYLDLIFNGNRIGERQVTNSIVRADRLIFTTTIPVEESCSIGGNSFLMELNTNGGTSLSEIAFDINQDGVLDLNDLLSANQALVPNLDGDVFPSGIRYDGVITEPTIINAGDKEFKIINSSTGQTDSLAESKPSGLLGSRTSWSEIQSQ